MNIKQHLVICAIRLRGKLDAELVSWFSELSFADDMDGNTLLQGELPDQSALLGILFRAHNLNLQIISVIVKDKNLLEVPNGNLQNA